MPSTIEQAKEAILKHGGKASKHQIARELKISLDYTGLICEELKRKGEIAFSGGFYLLASAKKGGIQDKKKKSAVSPSKRRVARRSNPLSSILGISESLAQTLEKAGYATVESLAEAPINKLMDAAKLELHTAAQLINQARKAK